MVLPHQNVLLLHPPRNQWSYVDLHWLRLWLSSTCLKEKDILYFCTHPCRLPTSLLLNQLMASRSQQRLNFHLLKARGRLNAQGKCTPSHPQRTEQQNELKRISGPRSFRVCSAFDREGKKKRGLFIRGGSAMGSCELRWATVSSVIVDTGCCMPLPCPNAAPGGLVSHLPTPRLCLSHLMYVKWHEQSVFHLFLPLTLTVEASGIRNQFPNHFQADSRKFNLPFPFPSPAQARQKNRARKVILEGKIRFTWRKMRRDGWLNDRPSSSDITSPGCRH